MTMEFLQWAIRNEIQLHFGESDEGLLNPVPFIRLQSPRRTVIYPLPRDAELMEEFLPWIIYRARAEIGEIDRTLVSYTGEKSEYPSAAEPALPRVMR